MMEPGVGVGSGTSERGWSRATRRAALRAAGAAAGAAALVGLAACGQKSGVQSTNLPTAIKEKVMLEVWHWDDFFAPTLQTIAERFTAANPAATVRVVPVTPVPVYYDKLQATIAGGTAPDVVGI